jgi:nitrogen fixation protein FixH
MSQNNDATAGLTGRHVLAMLVAFFTLVLAVNAYFIATALSTHTGVVANEPYRKGLKYNERIAADERQAALGWAGEIGLDSGGRRLVVRLEDAAGAPVRDLKVTAAIGRPATARGDATLELSEASPGHYEADIGLDDGGAYIASIEAVDRHGAGDGVLYRARRRLWLER